MVVQQDNPPRAGKADALNLAESSRPVYVMASAQVTIKQYAEDLEENLYTFQREIYGPGASRST
jgi:hypothetical protein